MTKTQIEQALHDAGLPQLSNLLTEIRSGIVQPSQFDQIAGQLNLPWLFLACSILHRQHPGAKIGFLWRDCELMEQVYRYYFDPSCCWIPFSRKAAMANTSAAVSHLKSYNRDLLVDGSSTGATWQLLAQIAPFPIKVMVYSDRFKYSAVEPVPPAGFSWVVQNSVAGDTNEMIELFNCGSTGSLLTCCPETYDENELTEAQVNAIHRPVKQAIALAAKYQGIKAELASLDDARVLNYFTQLLKLICSDTRLLQQVPHLLAKNQEVTMAARSILPEKENIPENPPKFIYHVNI
jgi:hypothetical protein